MPSCSHFLCISLSLSPCISTSLTLNLPLCIFLQLMSLDLSCLSLDLFTSFHLSSISFSFFTWGVDRQRKEMAEIPNPLLLTFPLALFLNVLNQPSFPAVGYHHLVVMIYSTPENDDHRATQNAKQLGTCTPVVSPNTIYSFGFEKFQWCYLVYFLKTNIKRSKIGLYLELLCVIPCVIKTFSANYLFLGISMNKIKSNCSVYLKILSDRCVGCGWNFLWFVLSINFCTKFVCGISTV